MCPNAYCEDHLPAESRVLGRCARFEALGQRHPTQACFVLCSEGCADWARARGEIDCDKDAYGTAAGIIGATGVDTTAQQREGLETAQQQQPLVDPEFVVDERDDLERLDDISRACLVKLVTTTKCYTVGEACTRLLSKASAGGCDARLDALAALLAGGTAAPVANDDDSSDDEAIVAHETSLAKVARWTGARPAHGREKKTETKAAAASLFLRLERALDTWRTRDLSPHVSRPFFSFVLLGRNHHPPRRVGETKI